MKGILAVSFVLLAGMALAIDKTTPSAILKSPAKFDHKVITVTGVVSHFSAKTSKAGSKYFLFDLMSGKDKIAVFGRGALKVNPKDGSKVEATGQFETARKSGDRVYKNELDVTSTGKDKNGVTVVK